MCGNADYCAVGRDTQGLLERIYMRQSKLSLLVLATILAASLSTHTDRAFAQNEPSTIDIIGVGATILNNWLNPPSRNAEIAADAEIRKAKIAADAEIAKEKLRLDASRGIGTSNSILEKWGVAQVPCAPGLVFINGVTNDTICIQPSKAISAGYYTYDATKQQLVKNNQNSQNPSSIPSPRTTPENVQTVQNVQTTRVSKPGNGF
jgi:hypothetical protein